MGNPVGAIVLAVLIPHGRPAPAARVMQQPRLEQPQAETPHAPAPTAASIAELYVSVGRELKALELSRGEQATSDLWPRYRWIRINTSLATPQGRNDAAAILDRVRHDAIAR